MGMCLNWTTFQVVILHVIFCQAVDELGTFHMTTLFRLTNTITRNRVS